MLMPEIGGTGLDPALMAQGWYAFQYRTQPETQLQVGSKPFPEIPMRSSSEMYFHLRKALGSHLPGSQYAININEHQYRSHAFIVAFDTEKQTNAGFSGLNTRAGDLITIKASGMRHLPNNHQDNKFPNSQPDFMHTTLEYDAILTITDAGVTILE